MRVLSRELEDFAANLSKIKKQPNSNNFTAE